jgi:RNA polymerase sigma factor (sigma-70 family)
VAPHAADVELARLCAEGDERAWETFVREYRPLLYRAADALDRTGRARDVADALYADLYGMRDGAAERRSLFRYFEGRSTLASWLRAVLAQRYVDRLRAERRLTPLPDEEGPAREADPPDPDRLRYVGLVRKALPAAVARLAPRDRLRLACYYVQELTLAETGRALAESEATASRQLAKTRRAIRDDVERQLMDAGMSGDQIAECFASIADDPGPLDLKQVIYE